MFYLSTTIFLLQSNMASALLVPLLTDCLIHLIEAITATLDKGDTDKKLIAFVSSVMLIALLEQIKSGVHAGPLSS